MQSSRARPKQGARTSLSGPIDAYLSDLLAQLRAIEGGSVATYIPELAKADPKLCAIVIATADGRIYQAGDSEHAFTIQSVSKPFVYGHALDAHGREAVMRRVGVEPTGDAFNAMVFDEANNRPCNPMVNAGAIAAASLVEGASVAERVTAVQACFSRFAGRALDIDHAVFQSERDTGDRNREIAELMFEREMIEGDQTEILDVYFSQCSVLTTCRDLALMGATLANGGVNPLTGERALSEASVCDVLTVMNTCGMYNYAGQWSFEVGVPAKSGVSGSILAVIPGQAGIAVFSPPIDKNGNSVRAIAGCKAIAADFGLHVFSTRANSGAVIRRVLDGAVARSKRARTGTERAKLDKASGRVAVIEAQEALFFGSAERLAREAQALGADHVIIDLRRVSGCDAAAEGLIARLCAAELEAGRRIVFAHVQEQGRLAALHARIVEVCGREAVFAHRDEALEWCENRLLAETTTEIGAPVFSLSELGLFSGLGVEDLRVLEAAAKPMVFEAGDVIVREGDAARLFFIVARGSASVRLKVPGEGGPRSVRVASIGPGMSFGEMALVDGGVRSADVVADERVWCYGFSVEELRDLAGSKPSILIALFGNMARDLSERLRRATNEIRALEH